MQLSKAIALFAGEGNQEHFGRGGIDALPRDAGDLEDVEASAKLLPTSRHVPPRAGSSGGVSRAVR